MFRHASPREKARPHAGADFFYGNHEPSLRRRLVRRTLGESGR